MMNGTREALVASAARLLDEGGVAAVTLRDVGRPAGVSHNAPYKHFAGKEALLAVIAAGELRRLHAVMDASVRKGPSSHAALRKVLDDYVAWARRCPERFELVFKPWNVDAAEPEEAAALAQRAFVDLVASAQRDGALPPGPATRAAALLRPLAHGAADLDKGYGEDSPEQLIDDLLEYLSGAARRAGGPASP